MKRLLLSAIIAATTMGAQAQNAIQLGGDLSMLPQYEKVSTPYYDSEGKKIDDVMTYLKETCQWNAVRVRLFVTPDQSTDLQVVQDLEYVKTLGKRIKDAGLDLLLDFHYSDTWADPDKQSIPATWGTTTDEALTDSMYAYTKRSLQYLAENGATPDFVQIGNEVSYGMLWRDTNDRCYSDNATQWTRFAGFLNAGAKAVHEVTPKAKIIIHVERTGDTNSTVDFYNKMKTYKVDYDIIGLSYYPFWHGTIATLSTTLNTLASTFADKPVQVVETAYYYQYFPTNDSKTTNTTGTWAATEAGQKAFIEDLIAELAKHDNVTGLYYWFPEENGNGGASWSADKVVLKDWVNRGLWNDDTHKANAGLYSLQSFLAAKKDAVGIKNVKAGQSDSPIYNTKGQRVSSMSAPGIYIKDGKKIMKK